MRFLFHYYFSGLAESWLTGNIRLFVHLATELAPISNIAPLMYLLLIRQPDISENLT